MKHYVVFFVYNTSSNFWQTMKPRRSVHVYSTISSDSNLDFLEAMLLVLFISVKILSSFQPKLKIFHSNRYNDFHCRWSKRLTVPTAPRKGAETTGATLAGAATAAAAAAAAAAARTDNLFLLKRRKRH